MATAGPICCIASSKKIAFFKHRAHSEFVDGFFTRVWALTAWCSQFFQAREQQEAIYELDDQWSSP
jgi:hypothetical protein